MSAPSRRPLGTTTQSQLNSRSRMSMGGNQKIGDVASLNSRGGFAPGLSKGRMSLGGQALAKATGKPNM